MFDQLRKGVVTADQDKGKGFVVAQQDVEAQLQALDQITFQEQRLDLALGGHDLHPPGLADHAENTVADTRRLGIAGDLFFRPGLADIKNLITTVEHAVTSARRARF